MVVVYVKDIPNNNDSLEKINSSLKVKVYKTFMHVKCTDDSIERRSNYPAFRKNYIFF